VIDFLNANAGAISSFVTTALLVVTAFYAWTTTQLLSEARQSRLIASQPRVVAYLRQNEVHSNIVQLCIANLSGSSAIGVSARLEKVTEWPDQFRFQDSAILRDLNFMLPHEVLRFDLGVGSDVFRDAAPAVFRATIVYSSLDGRPDRFDENLLVESVLGHSHYRIDTVHDVAQRLKEISNTLSGFTGFKRLQVETYDTADRSAEEAALEE
jgi:hypothetical protein